MKTISLLLTLAGRANTKKFKLMGLNQKAGDLDQFSGQLLKNAEFRVDNRLTFGTNQMGMGIGLTAVIAVTFRGQADFQNLPKLFEQIDGFIDRRQTGGGIVRPHLFEDILDAGVIGIGEEGFEHRKPLGRHPKIMGTQLLMIFSRRINGSSMVILVSRQRLTALNHAAALKTVN